ncbi:hypothetical protein F751_6563 [Auxenochlorella protothecoides]|uniref:Uncharacterized protein n=1 Tax=Auxenochlorella protothecoides TaxID=3075 RepID=A0A087STJ0_AUXPR|nr:hypothetical protein F751_6563 [Auxenochlorella protothecoides]KFM29044.1 hypothetical protein F751_6563 [Auxenochlorella protothecoides]
MLDRAEQGLAEVALHREAEAAGEVARGARLPRITGSDAPAPVPGPEEGGAFPPPATATGASHPSHPPGYSTARSGVARALQLPATSEPSDPVPTSPAGGSTRSRGSTSSGGARRALSLLARTAGVGLLATAVALISATAAPTVAGAIAQRRTQREQDSDQAWQRPQKKGHVADPGIGDAAKDAQKKAGQAAEDVKSQASKAFDDVVNQGEDAIKGAEKGGARGGEKWDDVKGTGTEKREKGDSKTNAKGVDAARERASELDDWTGTGQGASNKQ